jgi:hypothetical protein
MRCCASTRRQQTPASARATDDSAAGVQVGDDIREAGNGLDQRKRLAVERSVMILEPRARNRVVASYDGIERAEEPHEQHRKLKGLFLPLEQILAIVHPGNGWRRHAKHICQFLAVHVQTFCGPECGLGEDGRFVGYRARFWCPSHSQCSRFANAPVFLGNNTAK